MNKTENSSVVMFLVKQDDVGNMNIVFEYFSARRNHHDIQTGRGIFFRDSFDQRRDQENVADERRLNDQNLAKSRATLPFHAVFRWRMVWFSSACASKTSGPDI